MTGGPQRVPSIEVKRYASRLNWLPALLRLEIEEQGWKEGPEKRLLSQLQGRHNGGLDLEAEQMRSGQISNTFPPGGLDVG